MEKSHLKHGKIIFPKKLKLKKNIKISIIIGAGEIAYKYAEIIASFNHTLEAVLTRTKSTKNQSFVKKFKILNHFTKYDEFIEFIYENNISAIIVCVSWNKSYEIFKKILTVKKPILSSKDKKGLSLPELKNELKFNK